MNYWENIKIALISLKSNFLRSFLTLLIIMVGVGCLVGMLTAIDAILFSLSNNFNRLGANSFSISPKHETLKSNQGGRRSKPTKVIDFDQAINFKENFGYGSAVVSANSFCTGSATVKYQNEKTNPTVRLIGVDETYFQVSAFEISAGRNFTKTETQRGHNKVILGFDLVKNLFNEQPEKAIDKAVIINGVKYKVIGTLAKKGSALSDNSDRRVFISLMKAKQLYGHAKTNYKLIASVTNATEIDNAIAAATGIFRNIRKLKASEENDFKIRKSDGILETLTEITTELRWGTITIALMTLLGAAIGLMNIMLVSVTERTKEIGLRKSLGATKQNILIQFLSEAVVICQIGGIAGIFLGLLLGFGVSAYFNSAFVIPWAWISLGIIVCIFVGIISGLYPALRASALDPIESLRYE